MSYARIPAPDPDDELHAAFGSDNEDDEDLPMITPNTSTRTPAGQQPSTPGVYDFERDYDMPPPGSPPSTRAIPNTWGNSNGIIPTGEVSRPTFGPLRNTWFRRTLGSILPTHYTRLPSNEPNASTSTAEAEASTSAGPSGVVGGGLDNGGVFSNIVAKPSAPRTIVDDNGDVHIVPETSAAELPPTYADAEADAAPSYWATTVHAPLGMDGLGQMLIDDLPAGPLLTFIANLVVSYFFQVVGFLLTYLLHTNHAAKFGSRAGFGLTLITWGYNARADSSSPISYPGTDSSDDVDNVDADFPGFKPLDNSTMPGTMPDRFTRVRISSRVWISFLLMTIGWFFLLSSFVGFYRVKMWERHLLASQNTTTESSDPVNAREAIRRQIQAVFGQRSGQQEEVVEIELQPHRSTSENEADREDLELRRNLRSAGFI